MNEEENKIRPKLSINKTSDDSGADKKEQRIRQSFSHGRSKTVVVEVKKKRSGTGEGNSKNDDMQARLNALKTYNANKSKQEAPEEVNRMSYGIAAEKTLNEEKKKIEAERLKTLLDQKEEYRKNNRERDNNGRDGSGRRNYDRDAGGERPQYSGDRPQYNRRPYGDRPQGDRPQGDRPPYRPYGDRPQGDRPQYRPYGDRQQQTGEAGEVVATITTGDRPQGDRPQYNRRPYGDRPQGDRPYRPYGDRPQGDRPPYRPYGDRQQQTGEAGVTTAGEAGADVATGDRPQGDRPHYNRRPYGDRPQGDRPPYRPYGDRPQGDRPQGDRPPYRPYGDRPQGDRPPYRPYGDRPQGDRPPYRPYGDRPQGDRPQGDRPPYRPYGDRPQGDRPPYRPYGDRPQGDRPPYRPYGDRPQGDRPQGDRPYRPYGDRPQGDRPPYRPGGGAGGYQPGGGYQQRPPYNKPFGQRTPEISVPILDEERKRKPMRKPSTFIPYKPSDAPKIQPIKRNRLDVKRIATSADEEDIFAPKYKNKKNKKKHVEIIETVKVFRDVIVPDVISVQELANRMAVRGVDLVRTLIKMGNMVTVTQNIDGETAELLVLEFGHKAKRVSESDVETHLGRWEDSEGDMRRRPPIVTVMGHVDHGKTSLLDALRKTDVVLKEAGGITQHIGAYQVHMKSGASITFIDTPGHEAFSKMRSRGANVTDIVVLVVAADDGIKEQTIEAINHAKAAKVPIIVAVNKIDKPDSDPAKVKQDLIQHEVVSEDFGGDVLFVEVSAKKSLNLEKLEETILLQAEILDLKSNPFRPCEGYIIESKLDKGRGVVATVLVRSGTLRVGDIFVAGTQSGRVRMMNDYVGTKLKEALPATPVEVVGFEGVPAAGDQFFVVKTESEAREISSYRKQRQKDEFKSNRMKFSINDMMESAGKKEFNVVIKADVHGSIEAISSSLHKIESNEINVNILHSGVGGITESDVSLAIASKSMLVGFNVRANPQARDLARRDNYEISYYSIIYNVVNDVKSLMSGMLSPDLKENILGSVEIRTIFTASKIGKIAGSYVRDGIVKRDCKVRILRDSIMVHEGSVKSLRRMKDDAKEVREGYECGITFSGYNDIREGDIVECYEIQEIARTIA
jgi:translation initiation factor IF-2